MRRSADPTSRALLALATAALIGLACATTAYAGEAPVWRSAPALAPPPPAGVTAAPYAVPVGPVGQISFWAPNRGLLITGGNGPVPAGLYAYDGVDWHQLSTVCGGGGGRIAWAGPDEFWTISDQRSGQVLPAQLQAGLQVISLCHFLDGQVVGSYAMPVAQPDSYLHMDAAACYSPSDCWFGGEDGASPNFGAFHLHWDGSAVSVVYGPEDHAVTGMVNFDGDLLESVQIAANDVFPPSPPTARTNPPVIHTIAPAGDLPTFTNLNLYPVGSINKTLPEYESKAPPYDLEGFTLASDGSPLGVGATQLWAVANAHSPLESLTVLHCVEEACTSGEGWSQVVPSGAKELSNKIASTPAPEPGSQSAWLSLHSEGDAELARLNVNGELEEQQYLPQAQEVEVGQRGTAGAIACPAAHDCWMATTTGWLFHYTDGTQSPLDTDPSFAGVITYRPPDAGVPTVYPDLPPADDSLANQLAPAAPSSKPESVPATRAAKHGKAKALVTHIKSRLIDHRVLVISFVLTGRAHVQLIGRRDRRVVAKTRAESLRPGRHTLSLNLDPASWPTKLKFEAKPVESTTTAGGSVGGNDSITT